MLNPPFRPALVSSAATWAGTRVAEVPGPDPACCAADAAAGEVQLGARARLGELDTHLLCSVIGTCLSTAELRKLMARHIDVAALSDLDIHHEGVRLSAEDADVARALHKALDRRHEATVQRFTRAKDEPALDALWAEALRSGEVPGAYWAVLTHRRTPPALRQRVFGDVHMLSHLVGAANRADIRRLVALEKDNNELRERVDDQQVRLSQVVSERDEANARCERQAMQMAAWTARQRLPPTGPSSEEAAAGARAEALAAAVAVQAERRERAETALAGAVVEGERLAAELAQARAHATRLAHELNVAETQLRAALGDEPADALDHPLDRALRGRRVLYVGGRPSSMPAIRGVVQRGGGEFQRHDGGLEDRKGLLASALAWADLVVFPVDCVDHDSALALKRACLKQGRPFTALRSASVTSFAAGLLEAHAASDGDGGLCRRHA